MREKKNQYFLLHIVTTICLININFTNFFLMFFFFILLNEKQRIRYTVKKIGSYCLVIPYTVVHHKYSEACLNQTSGTKPPWDQLFSSESTDTRFILKFPIWRLYSGMIHFGYISDFRYSPLGNKFRTLSDLVINGGLERGCRWLQLFSLISNYFIY